MDVFICGDIVNYKNKDGLICSDELKEIIQGADFSIGNFEAPIHSQSPKKEKSGGHHSQVPETIKGLKNQGFDILCLANNHIMDYGEKGLNHTLDLAKEVGIDVLGAGLKEEEIYKPLIITKNGMKIGIINAGEAQFGVSDYYSIHSEAGYAWINHYLIDQMIMNLKETCDYVILCAHCGLENVSIPQKEWRLRYKHLCDLGVDVIIGSHPHVPQGIEHHNKSIIFYSLGNFYFDSKNFEAKKDHSFSINIKFEKEEINFELIYHSKLDGKVVLDHDTSCVNIDYLNSILTDNYEQRNVEISNNIYEIFIRKNLIYSISFGFYDGNLVSSLKRIIKLIFFKNKMDKDLTALHLIRNESYYYAMKCALNNKKTKF